MQIHEGSSTIVEMAKMCKLDQDLLQYYAELIDREEGTGTDAGLNIYPHPDDINYMHKIADEKGLIVSELTDEEIESLFNAAIAVQKSGCLEEAWLCQNFIGFVAFWHLPLTQDNFCVR